MPYSNEAIEAMRAALGKSMSTDELAKSGITTATGLVAYDLISPALLQIPVITPIREKLGRKRRASPGIAARWKVITAMQGSGIDGMGYIPEGARSGVKGITTKDAFSTYVPLGEEGQTSDEAMLAAQGFEDVLSTDRLLTLEKLMLKEEAALLFGNRSIKLGTPGTVTTTAPTVAGAVLNTTYYACVVALTAEGNAAASLSAGVVQAMTVTGQDSKTFTVNGGSSNKSAIATQAVTTGQGLGLAVAAIQGAVAYAWYVGTSNSAAALYLQKITTLNSVLLSTIVTTGTQTADAITADCSYNDGTQAGTNPVAAFDGLMTTALVSANNAYFKALATGVAGTGTALTSNGYGGIVEIDDMMISMWNNYRIGVDVLYMSANTARSVSSKILSNGSSPLLRVTKDSNDPDGIQFTAGGLIRSYFSPVGNPYGGGKAAVLIHPNLPDGVIVGWSNTLPVYYRNNETPAVAEILTRRDYYSIDWPRRTRATEYGVYADQTLAVYAPWAMGVIINVAV